jgi:hypothetical protein
MAKIIEINDLYNFKWRDNSCEEVGSTRDCPMCRFFMARGNTRGAPGGLSRETPVDFENPNIWGRTA